MSYAYTPGLKVKKLTLVRKQRILPLPGEVLVHRGDQVSYDTIVARTHVPGDIEMIPVAYNVGVEPSELPDVMLKKEGAAIKQGELLAESKSFFGLFKSEYYSDVSGTIELISDVTGMVGVRHPPVPVNLTAYVSGTISEVIPEMGVIVETPASFIQGIFGIGEERHGELLTIADPDEIVTEKHIGSHCEGKILAGGAQITAEALNKAQRQGIHGIIVGGIERDDLTDFLGYEIGVAITGREEIGLTCIITEGFGKMTMANHTYTLLNSLEGQLASINGATQIRAGVIRPEIIVTTKTVLVPEDQEKDLASGMEVGTQVRIIRRPYFGAIGHVESLPLGLKQVASESQVRVISVRLHEGILVTVPRANVEIMEA